MRLKRSFAEFLAVLLGVLGALLVEDFRDWRADRSAEEHALSGLIIDLESDVSELQSVARGAFRRATGAISLITKLDHGAEDAFLRRSVDSSLVQSALDMTFREAFQRVGAENDFDHADATFRELISTGRLETIENADLRRAVSSYYLQAQHVLDFTEPDVAHQSRLDGYFMENGIHRFLDDAELVQRITRDERIEASLHRVAGSALRYGRLMIRLETSADSLLASIRDGL